MWTFSLEFRFGKERVDTEAPEIYDLSSGQIERSDRIVGFSPAEGWEDRK